MITVTDKAAGEIKRIITQENDAELKLRMGVQGGGCSGLSYFLTLEKDTTPNDRVLALNGVEVVIDSKSYMYLDGTELDFTDGLSGKGFTFNNPNAVRTCGCGSSFSA
ncbi:MAG: iron-sulfur cluster insertion protein ErpA [Deferribacteres bacterium]|nr:iron-sulfur cluster insertion protein ErpA [candidate division KSB1 bacterium]MCB9511818.1 iron-sulfur cluster insertion protein ErpA [Deferribacteres bacterium]